jgi:hypothetical protein
MMMSRLDATSAAIHEHDAQIHMQSMASRKTLGGMTSSVQGQRGTAHGVHSVSSNRNSLQQQNNTMSIN